MKSIYQKAILGVIGEVLVFGLIIFFSAGTTHFWPGWLFLACFTLCVAFITMYFLKRNPELIARRVDAGPAAEKEKSQKVIQSFASLFFFALLVIPGLDFRFGWSHVPTFLIILANGLVCAGLGIVFLVFQENSFTTATIEVDKEQKVVTTGPYRWVRHPMYFGASVMIFFTALAMGSWWGLISAILLIFVIVARLLDEEKYLLKNLEGYGDYYMKTKYHLIPFIW